MSLNVFIFLPVSTLLFFSSMPVLTFVFQFLGYLLTIRDKNSFYFRSTHNLHPLPILQNLLMQPNEKTKVPTREVLPGIEPGFRDSESPVITVTLQDHTDHRSNNRQAHQVETRTVENLKQGPHTWEKTPAAEGSRQQEKKVLHGASGFRSPYLALAKRALFRLS